MKGGLVGLIIFYALIVVLYGGNRVGATSADWSWTQGIPTVIKSDPITFDSQLYCPTYIQNLEVSGLSARQDMCVFQGDDIRIGTFFENSGTPRAAVAYPLDTQFHILEEVCQGIAGCLYSAAQDALVSRYYTTQSYPSALLFRNVKARIHRNFDPATLSVRYQFDAGQPEYLVNDTSGHPLPVGAVGFSNNGEWFVVEIENLGIALVNTKTYTSRRVIASGIQYGWGLDPRIELAVSNDGRRVVEMGQNAGISFVEITGDCGEALVVDMPPKFSLGVQACLPVTIPTNQFISNFKFASRPVFDDQGGELDFYAASGSQGSRYVALRAAGYGGSSRLDYLVLGDSFSSGEGETSDRYYLPGTNDPFEKCHVSIRSYPFLIAALSGIPQLQTKSVACAGAKIGDVIGADNQYWGQGGRLGPKGRQLSMTEMNAEQLTALNAYYSGRIHQETFVRQYRPAVVSIGIGGNDAGFMDKLKVCAMPDTCEWAADQTARRNTGIEIQSLFDRLIALYKKIQTDSPLSKLLVVGYPKVIQPDGFCGPTTALLLNHDERKFMDQGISYINQVILAAARSVGAIYLNIESSLAGHELCSGSLSLAMNGLRVGDDIAPIGGLSTLKVFGGETFHPTPTGHELIAQTIVRDYPQALSPTECRDGSCMLAEAPPPLPTGWDDGGQSSDDEQQFVSDYVTSPTIRPTNPILDILLPSGSLQPDSIARVDIRSETASLGQLSVESDGGLSGSLNLPTNLAEGFHTVHLHGVSFSGQPVDLYQVISYGDIPEDDAASISARHVDSNDGDHSESSFAGNTILAAGMTAGVNGTVLSAITHAVDGGALPKVVPFIQPYILGIIVTTLVIGTYILVKIIRKRRIPQKNSSQDRGG